MSISDGVESIVREQLGIPACDPLDFDAEWSALGADDLEQVEMIMAVEQEFDLDIDDGIFQDITTNKVIRLLGEQL